MGWGGLFFPFFLPPSFFPPSLIHCSVKHIHHALFFSSVGHFLLILAALTSPFLSFIPSASVERPSTPHPLSSSSCSFYSNWLSTSQTAASWLSPSDHPYSSVPHFLILLFPSLSLLMPSCGVTGVCIDDNTWHGAWACVTVPQLLLHSHCGCNTIITPHDGQGRGRAR